MRYSVSPMYPAKLVWEKLSPSDDRLLARLKGNLSLETVHNFIETMRAEQVRHLILEMSEVSFMDSAGVGALASLFVTRRNAGKTLALAGMKQNVVAVLQVAGLVKLLPIYSTAEEALGQNQ